MNRMYVKLSLAVALLTSSAAYASELGESASPASSPSSRNGSPSASTSARASGKDKKGWRQKSQSPPPAPVAVAPTAPAALHAFPGVQNTPAADVVVTAASAPVPAPVAGKPSEQVAPGRKDIVRAEQVPLRDPLLVAAERAALADFAPPAPAVVPAVTVTEVVAQTPAPAGPAAVPVPAAPAAAAVVANAAPAADATVDNGAGVGLTVVELNPTLAAQVAPAATPATPAAPAAPAADAQAQLSPQEAIAFLHHKLNEKEQAEKAAAQTSAATAAPVAPAPAAASASTPAPAATSVPAANATPAADQASTNTQASAPAASTTPPGDLKEVKDADAHNLGCPHDKPVSSDSVDPKDPKAGWTEAPPLPKDPKADSAPKKAGRIAGAVAAISGAAYAAKDKVATHATNFKTWATKNKVNKAIVITTAAAATALTGYLVYKKVFAKKQAKRSLRRRATVA